MEEPGVEELPAEAAGLCSHQDDSDDARLFDCAAHTQRRLAAVSEEPFGAGPVQVDAAEKHLTQQLKLKAAGSGAPAGRTERLPLTPGTSPLTPVCALTHAAMASTDDSGASLPSAPSAVVDSVQAVSLLRRTHLRYRGHHSVHHSAAAASRPDHAGTRPDAASLTGPTSAAITAGSGDMAVASRLPQQAARPRCTQLYIKLPGLDPNDLRPGFVAAVNESLQLHGSPLQVVGAAVRRGCVELTLDLMEREDAAAAVAALLASGNAAAVQAAAADAELSEVLDLPALILSAMGVPQTSGGLLRLPTGAGAAPYADSDGGESGEGEERSGQCVFVQRRGNCWSLQWDPDAMTWAVRDQPVDRLDAVSAPFGAAAAGASPAPQVMLHAPMAAHAEEQLAAAVAVAAQQQLMLLAGGSEAQLGAGSWPKLRLAVAVQGCEAWRFAGCAAAEAAVVGALEGAAAADLSLVAKANGRCVDVPVLSLLRSGGALALQVEVDVALLAAGRPSRCPGLVLRLELWRGAAPPAGSAAAAAAMAAEEEENEAAGQPPRMLDAVCVACLREAGPVSELQALQRDLAAAGQLDPCDDAFLSGPEQREEAEQLLGDLATWLDFVAALHGSAAGAAGRSTSGARGRPSAAAGCVAAGRQCRSVEAAAAKQPPAVGLEDEEQQQQQQQGERNELDLSGEVAHLLLEPDLQPTLLAAGQHLLEHFVQHGRAELARCVHEQLAAAVQRLAAAGGAAAAAVPALASPACRGGNVTAAPALTLLHRAVRSGSQRMTELVLQWYRESEQATEAGAATGTVWDARAPGGITPLHILAAEARCLPPLPDQLPSMAAAAAPSDPGSPTAAEALLRWIMASFPDAVTVWNTARDAAGNTPAALWAALGGGDMQLVAAAAALEQVAAAAQQSAAPGEDKALKDLSGAPSAPAPRVPSAIGAKSRAAEAHGQGSSSATTSAPVPAPTAAASASSSGAVARLLAAPPTLSQLMRLAVSGFPDPAMERSYMHYVTVTARGTTFIWVVIMVLAHVAAFVKSLHTGEARQTLVGGFSYCLALCFMVFAPRAYVALREPLMLSCLGGRTVCRALLWLAPQWVHMSDNVVKYIVYGLDILLDGALEGTFEQARFPRVAVARLVEWFFLAQFIHSYGIAGPRLAANLARAAVTSSLGLAMSGFMDVRMRAAFLRDSRLAVARAAAGGGAGAAVAPGSGAGIAAAFAAGVQAGGEAAGSLKRKAD
ncbi:hypothetical protein HYH02_007803 [Chlamydomonas schloesseri]|uniref:Uncharacterized protein n=1 Tax=Chlamydomonas schloesseri TaxID=2026947 RepID=A0A836B446_9CHLO|nr:hypothetical protein HYH02_007803 [Chlamydomonas schloesseri]|eukprot:KAG2447052.1 hypothetical protein HYH02_007803 [Chlamydomonas schloesseri]